MTPSRSRILSVLFVFLFVLVVAAGPAHAKSISSYKWYPMGPEPGCCFFPGGETGRATAVAVNPANPGDIWVGTAGGGVWHSTNGGQSWLPMTDDQASLAIGSIALAGCTAVGCNYVYAGTGENGIRRDTYYGTGLLVGTLNGGSYSWTMQIGQPRIMFNHGSIYNVVLDPNTSGASQVIYITLSSGVTASATESTVTAPAPYPGGYGIFKSTDNGASWSKVFSVGRPTDLEMDRTNSSVMYAGFLGLGIFKTTDGGTKWCPLNPGLIKPAGCPMTYGLPDLSLASTNFDHVEIAAAPSDHNHLYATFGLCPDRLVPDCAPMVYESADAGVHWTQRFAGDSNPTPSGFDVDCPRGYSRYTHGLTVDPTDPNTVFLEGYHICVSTDHGASWSATDDNTRGFELHPDHHAIVFFEADPNRAYDVNDGGVALSRNHGATWTPSVQGLATVEFQSIATSALTKRIIGGTQDNAGMMWLGSKQWAHLPCCGDGGFSILDRTNVNNMYITTNTGGLANLTVIPVRSFDGGKTFPSPSQFPNYDSGINNTESRSFYPPFFQSVAAPFFFGTNRLFRSNNTLTNWFAQSPTFSTDTETEIYSGADAITAIAEAPSNTDRMYVGLYSGKLFVTSSACTTFACWPQRNSGLPAAPVTWIAVHPTQPDTAYATLSGFFGGIHVYKTINAGLNWNPTGSIAELDGVPANTIAIEPSDPNIVFLGTDHGIYKSTSAGGAWFRFSNGLPNVPVYALALDAPNGRAVAATHGRGAWALTSWLLTQFVDGPISKFILDQPAFGSGFLPLQGCSMSLLRQDGSVCASGSTDALGGTLMTDAAGFLVSSKSGFFTNLPVVWACAQGRCLGSDLKDCAVPGNPMASLEVSCGIDPGPVQSVAVAVTIDPGPISDPPSSLLSLAGLTGGPLASAEPADNAAVTGPAPSVAGGGSFQLAPALQLADGSSRFLCAVNVPFTAADTAAMVLQNATNAINTDPGCEASGVSAEFKPPNPTDEVEDLFAHPGHLRLMAPALSGSELIPSVRAGAGMSTGLCFNASKLGNPTLDQIRAMKVHFTTGASGAMGGTLTLAERSSLGECSITVPTSVGETPSGIALAVEAAFQAAGIPGPNPDCPSGVNPRDVMRMGDAVVTALPSEVIACSNDPGVGVAVAPRELCQSDAECDDGNPCTTDTCNLATGHCQTTPAPNGLPCNDGNACTIGDTCFAGTCGTPVVCNDRNACTTDTCDPATGACLSQPVTCDDGNPCTIDSCDGSTGQCVFAPLPGLPCDDGDLCTTGDMCVQPPGTPVPICQGNPKCADADACTADLCEPTTGQCSNPPIVCDDGNSCTLDVCQAGVCNAFPAPAGQPCDDGDRCTIGDMCVGPPTGGPTVCMGQPLVCNDGNTCTADQCNPITASCDYTPVPPGDVTGLVFTSQTAMTWTATPGASYWNTYRGAIPSTLLGRRGPGLPVYDQTCFERDDSHGDGALIATDGSMPPPDTAFYYLVSQVTGCGEGPPGTDWNGSAIPNPSPCPLF